MSTQVDQFIHQHLPAASAMPQLIFERPELQFSEQLNAVVELLDRRVAAGHGARILLRDARERTDLCAGTRPRQSIRPGVD